jgi:UrcA family protein
MSSNPRLSRIVIHATFVAGVFLLAVSAQAAGPSAQDKSVHQKTVSYADLNLSSKADVAALYARLRAASRSVCGSYDLRDLAMRRLHKDCVDQALSDAVEQVDHAALSTLHGDSSVRIRVAQKRGSGESRT